MYIKTLTLTDFRNYKEESFEFSDGINILTGANAQGKTNMAEALFYLCTGYSPKAVREKQLIRAGAERAKIYGNAVSKVGNVSVEATLTVSGEKEIKVNGAKVSKMGDLFGNINSVFFNPSELKLVQESPEDRRRFMNISLSQMSKQYFYALCRYNKILAQRNNLLKSFDRAMIADTLPVWDLQMSKEASKIFYMRNKFIADLAPIAKQIHAELSGGEVLKISPENAIKGDEQEIADLMYIQLRESYEKDLKLGFTNVGPHREDIKFVLNGTDVRHYGSQGQQRTVALSIKLAEVELFKNNFGEYPVLILDDVLSELDRKRQRMLFKRINGVQTILTATHIESALLKGLEHVKFTIENGRVTKRIVKINSTKN